MLAMLYYYEILLVEKSRTRIPLSERSETQTAFSTRHAAQSTPPIPSQDKITPQRHYIEIAHGIHHPMPKVTRSSINI